MPPTDRTFDDAPRLSLRRTARHALTGFGMSMVVVLLFAVFFLLNFKTVVVSGDSMLPTFKTGQRLLTTDAYWLVGNVRRDDVVVIRETNPDAGTGYFIKRVYKLAGETVDMVNVPRAPLWRLAQGPFVVPQGSIYVLGDNREVSSDSREFGPVPMSRVLGKVIHVR